MSAVRSRTGTAMPDEEGVLYARVEVAVITCPEKTCATEFEGAWQAAEEPGEYPADELQLCPGCGNTFTAGYPGYSFSAEAG
jgi:uncharacterized protein (UPF0212 family)